MCYFPFYMFSESCAGSAEAPLQLLPVWENVARSKITRAEPPSFASSGGSSRKR